MKQLRGCIVLVLTSVFFFTLGAQSKRNNDITVDELRNHLKYIASDELQGRRAGSDGADKVAEYIAREFKAYGLSPAGEEGTFFQPFEFVAGVKMGSNNSFTASTKGKEVKFSLNEDFRPLGFSSTGVFEGAVVFAGYGIASKEKGYDDFEGIDVKGKAVIVLRFHPEGDNQHSDFNQYASLRYKATKAREQGATALIVVTGPADADKDELMRLTYDQSAGSAGIPSFTMTQAAVNRLLASGGMTVQQLQEGINKEKKPRSMILDGVTVKAAAEVEEIRKTSKNVLGYLEGSEAGLKNEVLVVGAHYDHLGMGGENSGSLQPDTVAVHNGADDNGSGTVGLLELAQYYGSQRASLKRSMLFTAFTGEEMGLLGSAHFVKDPTIPLSRIVTMLNMDMIGRLNEGKLIVYGIGTSPGFEELAQKANADSSFVLKLNKDGFGPSDQSSFYGKNIPVFHFFTDLHGDYHRPSDDWQTINYEGMRKVLEYVRTIATTLDTTETKPQYVQVEQPRPAQGSGRGIRSYTGTIPDFGETVAGMKISGVRDGSPAAKAGLQGGDIIIKFGTIDIKNLYDYTFALGEYKPGDQVEVVVKRGNETVKLKLTLDRRP